MVPAAVHVVTLGARDLDTLRGFYLRLGWSLAVDLDDFAAFQTAGAVLALFPLARLAADARALTTAPQRGMRGFSLAIVVPRPEHVDQEIPTARQAGGRITKEPVAAEEFEGRSAYFADPEDNFWEVAYVRAESSMAAAIRRATGAEEHPIGHHPDGVVVARYAQHTGDPMPYRLLTSTEMHWRPSNQMGLLNTDLARQLEIPTLGARLWRLRPGEASTRHRHHTQTELYVLLEGRGRVRVEDDLLSLRPLDALAVEPPSVRQVFNDTAHDQLWLIVGAPPEPADTREMSEEQLHWLYPDGPRALPPELER